ncbi:MAG: hypothetical protein ACKVI6_02740 [Candidatus Poseidoniales archaeon]|jgi:hypothetical protein
MDSIQLDFTPLMVNRNNGKFVVIGNSGELIKLNSEFKKIENASRPFPTPLISGVIFEDIWVGIWLDRDLGDARIAALPLSVTWEDGIGRDVLRTSPSFEDSEIIPNSAIWQKILTSEPMALGKIDDNIVFAMMSKGIYMVDQNGEEIWREHYPTWPEIGIPEGKNPIIKIIKCDSGIVIWSTAGGLIQLDSERNVKERRVVKLKDKITDIRYDICGGWFIMLHGKYIALMQELSDTPVIIKTPGPVIDAHFSEGEWKWTGWRHDGKIKISNDGIQIKDYKSKPRNNIGIHIFDDKIITNDGQWENYSS